MKNAILIEFMNDKKDEIENKYSIIKICGLFADEYHFS
jgi:hypothetical protein